MDRIQPSELEGVRNSEAFGENAENDVHRLKNVAERRGNGKQIKPLVLEVDIPKGQNDLDLYLESAKIKGHEDDLGSALVSAGQPPPTPPTPHDLVTKSPQIAMSPHHIELFPFATFEYLNDVATFVMTRTGPNSAKISTTPSDLEQLTSDLDLFRCEYSEGTYWEGCNPEALEKRTTIYDTQNSKLVMQLHYVMPPCNSCFEEESNRIEIFGADERLMATILQKKTWVGSRVDREILIEPGPYGKCNTYTASFTWSDASINFKSNRSGIVVATLMTDCVEKGKESSYVLQFLRRDVCPRDKVMLVAFTLARDTLMSDESHMRQAVERTTMFLVIIAFIVICTYLLNSTKQVAT